MPMQIKALTYRDKLWQSVSQYAENCSWRAGKNLADKMSRNDFSDWEKVIVALDGENVAGFCTVAKTDCIPDVPYTPYISFMFVGETHRGNRLSEQLIQYALNYLKELGFDTVYLVSDHIGLYEKYGFVPIDTKPAPWGAMETIFSRSLL